MIELGLNKVKKYYGATMVLEDITFEVQTGEKMGIVGCNGCGKSTLLKIIMGMEEYDEGTLSIKKGSSLGYLEQMPSYPDYYKTMDVLYTAFEQVESIHKELEMLEGQLSNIDEPNMDKLLNKYAILQADYENLGGYEIEERISKVCMGLKIDSVYKEKAFSQLSGGEKTTVNLGKILLQNPEILLLDEPSNHLDLDSMEWLEDYLKEYNGIVIIVSHDRYFLDNVVTRIIEIEDKTSKGYQGNYSEFVKEKERQVLIMMDNYLDQQKKIKAMEKSITQLLDWGSRGDNVKFFRRAASMQKQLDKIQQVDKPVLERERINIKGNTVSRSGRDVIIIKDLYKSFGEKVLFDNAQMLIRNKERVALIGANGGGKSTIIKVILGIVDADHGSAVLGSSIKLGYLPQNVTFLNENQTILECFQEDIVITTSKAREYLAKYMFVGEGVFRKVNNLSGGERSRLKLAIMMYSEVNLLILDEPTNHLDIDSREELEEYLKDFKGTLLFVSHDRYFINNIASRVVELTKGNLISYEGNYEYYKEKSTDIKSKENVSSNIQRNKTTKTKEEKIPKTTPNHTNNGEKLRLELKIESVEQNIGVLDEKMNQCFDNYEELNNLYNEKVILQKELDKLLEEYIG